MFIGNPPVIIDFSIAWFDFDRPAVILNRLLVIAEDVISNTLL